MVEEKEPNKITRRQFLKGAAALGASALLSSCGPEASSSSSGKETTPSSPELSPIGTPMTASASFPESTTTETPSSVEPTSPREIITFPQVQITPDLLKQGFVGIGGEEEINLSAMGGLHQGESQERVSWQTIEGYTSLAWDEKIALADLAQDEVKAAKALISLGAQAGVEGFYQPKEILPQFEDLTLLRLTINQLPDNQDFYDAKVNASPQNLMIRKGTHLTLLGLFANESGRWATVAFDEGFDREKEGLQPREVPRQFLAVIPQNLPDEKEGFSLESLLAANGYAYQGDTVEHQAESGQVYRQQLNSVEPTLAKKLEKEAGALFRDQKPDGSWYENPIIPYPPEEQTSFHTVQSGETLAQIAQSYGLTLDELLALNPDIKDPSKITVGQELTILIPGFTGYHGPVLTEDGRVVILSQDQTQELAQAKYDEEAKAWEWEATVESELTIVPTATEQATVKPTEETKEADILYEKDFEHLHKAERGKVWQFGEINFVSYCDIQCSFTLSSVILKEPYKEEVNVLNSTGEIIYQYSCWFIDVGYPDPSDAERKIFPAKALVWVDDIEEWCGVDYAYENFYSEEEARLGLSGDEVMLKNKEELFALLKYGKPIIAELVYDVPDGLLAEYLKSSNIQEEFPGETPLARRFFFIGLSDDEQNGIGKLDLPAKRLREEDRDELEKWMLSGGMRRFDYLGKAIRVVVSPNH